MDEIKDFWWILMHRFLSCLKIAFACCMFTDICIEIVLMYFDHKIISFLSMLE